MQVHTDLEARLACRGLIYRLFQQPTLSARSGGTVIALVAAHPAAGTTYLTNVLNESLNSDVYGCSVSVDCRTFSQTEDLGARIPQLSERQSLRSMELDVSQTWRSSRDIRARYINDLRDRHTSVLIDCPSLKESTDVLGLASLVDGVLLVIEANKTSKQQVGLLERTIEGAGGNVVGHMLNKRTYPIPDWAYKILESCGV